MKERYWKVPVGELLDVESVGAEDVLSRSEAIVLSVGLSLAEFREMRPEIVPQLLRLGITHVRVGSTPAVTAEEFRSTLRDAGPPIAVLTPLLTSIAVHQFRVLQISTTGRSGKTGSGRCSAPSGSILRARSSCSPTAASASC